MSKITAAIAARNFEVIRDRIAFILKDELAAQLVLQPTELVLGARVWLEKFTPVDKEDFPSIVVYTSNVDYENMNPKTSQGQNVYNIDCYVKHKHEGVSDDEQGDTLSSKSLSRLMGVIQYILSSEEYAFLDFAPGLIQRRWVKSFLIDRISGEAEGTHIIKGRVEFHVNANEEVNDPASVDVGDFFSEFLIEESDKGYEILVEKTP